MGRKRTYVSKKDGKTYAYPKWGYANEEGMLWNGRYENWADKLVEAIVMIVFAVFCMAGYSAAIFAISALFK